MNPRHPKCGKTSPGGTQHGHCAACCETFSGLAAFEAHRAGSHSQHTRHCLNPATQTATDGTNPFWQDEKGYWHIGERMTDEQKRARGWIK